MLEQARDLLQRTETLKSLTSSHAEPHGLLRIGLAHPLAEGTFIEPIRALTEKYPKVLWRGMLDRANPMGVRVRASSSLSSNLKARIPEGKRIVWMKHQVDRLDPMLPSPPSILDREGELRQW